MFGRITRSLICIGAITVAAMDRAPAPDAARLIADARRAVASHAQGVCFADLGRCAHAVTTIGDLVALIERSGDTLTDADRAIPTRRASGG